MGAGTYDRLNKVVNSTFAGRQAPVVLEAGCGSMSYLRYPQGAWIVGIDISQDQLCRNKSLNEKICGDIQYYELPPRCFDAVVCWDVLEHVERPELALERFVGATKEGGIIVISAPNPLSTKGIVTKITPYWVHLWFYRNMRGLKEAGSAGNPPFPTYLKMSMAPGAIRDFAARSGLTILYESLFGYGDSRDVMGRKSKPLDMMLKMANLLFRVGSLGYLTPEAAQYHIVLQKMPLQGSPLKQVLEPAWARRSREHAVISSEQSSGS